MTSDFNSYFLVRLDKAIEAGMTYEQRSEAIDQYEQSPEEWELHPTRWNKTKFHFVQYQRMNIPIDALAYGVNCVMRGHELSTGTLDQWGDLIELRQTSSVCSNCKRSFRTVRGLEQHQRMAKCYSETHKFLAARLLASATKKLTNLSFITTKIPHWKYGT